MSIHTIFCLHPCTLCRLHGIHFVYSLSEGNVFGKLLSRLRSTATMASVLTFVSVFIMLMNTACGEILQCCSDPIQAFILKQFHGPCACQTLLQKWERYKDWVHLNGGYIHKDIELRYTDKHSLNRGIIAKQDIKWTDLLMQIPIKITFSQFIISKYIPKNKHLYSKKSKYLNKLFPPPQDEYFMPTDFPDWHEFDPSKPNRVSHIWLALGMEWIRTYTRELLPFFELFPENMDCVPLLFPNKEKLLNNTAALERIRFYQQQFEQPHVDKLIKILNLDKHNVLRAYAFLLSNAFGLNYQFIRNGAASSPSIPSGNNLFNHNIFSQSSSYFHPYFGQKRMRKSKTDRDSQQIRHIIKNEPHLNRNKPQKIDWQSAYLWIDQNMKKGEQIYINYGERTSSVLTFARYGFVNEEHPNDFVVIHLDFQDAEIHNIEELEQMDEDCWGYYDIRYDGSSAVKLEPDIYKCLRLVVLGGSDFDSFTVSSILNGFEAKYIGRVVDEKIKNALRDECQSRLSGFDTTYEDDIEAIQYVKPYSMMYNVLAYKIREKGFYKNCTKLLGLKY